MIDVSQFANQIQSGLAQQAPPEPGSIADLENRGRFQPAPPPQPIQGSVEDLENQAQPRFNTAQTFQPQFQQPAQQPQQQPGQPVQYSPQNPFAPMVRDYQQRTQNFQSAPNVKGLLNRFLTGLSESANVKLGLPTATQQRQQDLQNLEAISQHADAWEANQNELRYHQALLGQLQSNMEFESQLRPFQLQRAGLENQQLQQQTQERQNAVHPAMTAQDLQSLGLSPNLSQQFAGKPLSSADMAALTEMSSMTSSKLFDYGADGTGQGKGIWLVNRNYEPIRQISPISENARGTAIAKLGAQQAAGQGIANQTAIDIVEGRLDPSQLSKRGSSYGQTLAAAQAYSQQKYGQPFDFSKASSDYKFASNPQTKNTLNYLNSLTGPDGKSGNLQEVINLSNDIGRTPFPPLNDVAAWARLETGSTKIAQFHAAVTEVADQVAKIMQGGGTGTSDAKMRQAMDLFRTGFNKDQIKGVASTLQGLLQNRKTSMIGNNTYLQRWYPPRK